MLLPYFYYSNYKNTKYSINFKKEVLVSFICNMALFSVKGCCLCSKFLAKAEWSGIFVHFKTYVFKHKKSKRGWKSLIKKDL